MTLPEIITYLTPILIFVATWITTKLLPLIPGWATLLVVSALSGILAYLTQLLATPELSWFLQFALGLGSIIISQILKQFSPTKILADKEAIAEIKNK